MELPVAIHKDVGSVYGVTVPDVPGCFSWGDTIAEALHNVKDAIYGHFEALAETGESLEIGPSQIEDLIGSEEFVGAIWALVDVDASKLDTKPERINISLPRFVLQKIDAYASSRHETRSGLLSRAALDLIARELEPA